jgi:hypothetical protein
MFLRGGCAKKVLGFRPQDPDPGPYTFPGADELHSQKGNQESMHDPLFKGPRIGIEHFQLKGTFLLRYGKLNMNRVHIQLEAGTKVQQNSSKYD